MYLGMLAHHCRTYADRFLSILLLIARADSADINLCLIDAKGAAKDYFLVRASMLFFSPLLISPCMLSIKLLT